MRVSSKNTPQDAQPPNSSSAQASRSVPSSLPPNPVHPPVSVPASVPASLPQPQSTIPLTSTFQRPAINPQAPPPSHVPALYATGVPLHQGVFGPPTVIPPTAIPINMGMANPPANQPVGDVPAVNGQYAPHLSYMEGQLATQAMLMEQQRRIQHLERELAKSRSEIIRLRASGKEKEAASDGSSRAGSHGVSDTTAEKKASSRYWTNDEHKKFLEGLDLFGQKDIKSIARHVGTRSATQVRTHAQKYYLRLQREKMKRDKLEEERIKAQADLNKTCNQNAPVHLVPEPVHVPIKKLDPVSSPLPSVPLSASISPNIVLPPTTNEKQRQHEQYDSQSARTVLPSPDRTAHAGEKNATPQGGGQRVSPRIAGRRKGSLSEKKEPQQHTSGDTPPHPAAIRTRSPRRHKRARSGLLTLNSPEKKRHHSIKPESTILPASMKRRAEGRRLTSMAGEGKNMNGVESVGAPRQTMSREEKGETWQLPERRVITVSNTRTQDILPSSAKPPSALKRLTNSGSVLSDLSKGVYKPLSRTNSYLFGGRELRRSNSILSLLSGIPTSLRESASTDKLSNLLPFEGPDDKPSTSLRSFDANASSGNLSGVLMGERSLSLVHLNMLSDELDERPPVPSSGSKDNWS